MSARGGLVLLRVVEVELLGADGGHDDVEDAELAGGEGADHDAPRAEARRAQRDDPRLGGDVAEALHHRAGAARAALVDLREERVGGVGDDGGDDAMEDYLGELADGVISIAQSPDYAVTIYEAHLRRELIRIGDDVIQDASHPDVDLPATTQIETAEAKLFQLAETGEADAGLRGFDSVTAAAINQAAIARKSDGGLSGYSTGLTDLNNLMGGMHRSDLIILAGRPAMGKSALATTMAFHTATTTRTGETAAPVAFFSLEMSAEQLATRMLAERSGVISSNIRKGDIHEDEYGRLIAAARDLNDAPLFIDHTFRSLA